MLLPIAVSRAGTAPVMLAVVSMPKRVMVIKGTVDVTTKVVGNAFSCAFVTSVAATSLRRFCALGSSR